MEGLIHISELSEQRVAHPKEVVHEGDVLTLRVIKIEPERHRIGLSLRKVDSPAYADLDWKTTLAEVVEETHGEEAMPTLAEIARVEEDAESEEMSATPQEPEMEASAYAEETGEVAAEVEEVASTDLEEKDESPSEPEGDN
jgi:small subunit ribosomal protein S1